MGESIKFIETPLASPRVHAKAMLKLEKNIDKLSSGRILMHLYRKHEIGILYVAVTLCFAWGFAQALTA